MDEKLLSCGGPEAPDKPMDLLSRLLWLLEHGCIDNWNAAISRSADGRMKFHLRCGRRGDWFDTGQAWKSEAGPVPGPWDTEKIERAFGHRLDSIERQIHMVACAHQRCQHEGRYDAGRLGNAYGFDYAK